MGKGRSCALVSGVRAQCRVLEYDVYGTPLVNTISAIALARRRFSFFFTQPYLLHEPHPIFQCK